MRPARGRIDTFARRRRSENAVARCANIEAPANKGPLLVLLRGMSQESTESLQFVLLEDDPNDAELIQLELARNGLNVHWRHAASEKTFREALAEGAVDLVLADYTLPGFDGLAALKITQKTLP